MTDKVVVMPVENVTRALPSVEQFQTQTKRLAKKSEYPALIQALGAYQQASNFEEFSKATTLLQQQLEKMLFQLSYSKKQKEREYLISLRNFLNDDIQEAIRQYSTDSLPTAVPKQIHFSCIGQLLTPQQQSFYQLWKTAQAGNQGKITLWYDSDALFVELFNRCLLESAFKLSLQKQSGGLKNFLQQLGNNLYQLKAATYQQIQQAIDAGESADAVRRKLLITHYQQSEERLTTCLTQHQQVIQQLMDQGVDLQDIRPKLEQWLLAPYYQRELNQQGHLKAANQMASYLVLQSQGGIYSTQEMLPSLADSFWRELVFDEWQYQNVAERDEGLLQKKSQEWQQQWQQDRELQQHTWELLQHYGLQTESSEKSAPLPESLKSSAILSAIDRYLQREQSINRLFTPLESCLLTNNCLGWLEIEPGSQVLQLLLSQPKSPLWQAVFQQIQVNYQALEQLEQSLKEQGKSLQDREARIEAIHNLKILPSLARALTDYYVEGTQIGADSRRVLSGLSAIQQGMANYRSKQLIPERLFKQLQQENILLPANLWWHPLSPQPFSEPLVDKNRAQHWYQQYKEAMVVTPVEQELTQLALLNQLIEQPSQLLPELAFGQEEKSLLHKEQKWTEALDGSLVKLINYLAANNNIIMRMGIIALRGLLTWVPRAVKQFEEEVEPYIAMSRMEKLKTIIKKTLDIQQDPEIVSQARNAQVARLNQLTQKLNRTLLKNQLSDEIDTVVHSELVLKSDPITGNAYLANRSQSIDASQGVNQQTIPQNNFLEAGIDPQKSVLFNLGAGDHKIKGTLDKRNLFLLSEGQQWFTGGNKGDCFILSLTAEEMWRQIKRTAQEGRPLLRLSGNRGNNQLLIYSDLPSSIKPTDDLLLEPIDYYEANLQQGKLWFNQNSSAQSKQRICLMTFDNIQQLALHSKTAADSVIWGSTEGNIIVMNHRDKVYLPAGNNQLIIQGGGTVQSQSGGNVYHITNQVNQPGDVEIKIIETASEKPSCIQLPIDHHQLSDWRLVDNDLTVVLGQEPQSCRLTLADVYRHEGSEQRLQNARLADFYPRWVKAHPTAPKSYWARPTASSKFHCALC